MKRILVSLALLGALSGCMSSGVEVKPEQTADFRPGVTTKQEVQAKLGVPTTDSTLPDGSEIFVYAFTAAQVRATTFIPIVGAFIGGADAHTTSVAFQFGPDGVLKGTSHTASQAGSQMGTTTTTQPMQTDQPRQVQ